MRGQEDITDKRQRILDATIREFAEKGYAKASTNSIVKEAGIAKGLLFHYFGTKKDLYLHALDHCIGFYVDYFLENMGDLPADFVDRLMAWGTLKIKMLSLKPLMYIMAVSSVEDAPEHLKPELAGRFERVSERLMPVFLGGMDFSRLREGVDPKKAVEFALLVLNAVSEKFIAASRGLPDRGLSDLSSAFKEMEDYAEFIRSGLYGPTSQ